MIVFMIMICAYSAFKLTLKNIKLHMKAKETTLEEPVQTEIL